MQGFTVIPFGDSASKNSNGKSGHRNKGFGKGNSNWSGNGPYKGFSKNHSSNFKFWNRYGSDGSSRTFGGPKADFQGKGGGDFTVDIRNEESKTVIPDSIDKMTDNISEIKNMMEQNRRENNQSKLSKMIKSTIKDGFNQEGLKYWDPIPLPEEPASKGNSH